MRSALKSGLLPEFFTMARYRCSPYMGCGHGCSYCDGRAERYYVEGEFDRDIICRRNLPDLLHKELPRLREYGPISISSGITDAYQPIEAELGITRACAEILQHYQFPVTVLTKSSLIERDLAIWRRVNQQSSFLLIMTLTTLDEEVTAAFEPGAPTVAERLQTLQRFKDAGCSVGVLAMPLLPGLSDSDESLSRLYQRLQQIPVDFIVPGGLTLRPGRQKQLYLTRLDSWLACQGTRPHSRRDLRPLYARLYENNLASGSPLPDYRRQLEQRFRHLHSEFQLAPFIPHSVYRQHLNRADELYILLHQLQEWYSGIGVDTSRLQAINHCYTAWISERKKALGTTRGSGPTHNMQALIDDALHTGELAGVIGNPRLFGFIREVCHDGRLFAPWLQSR
ncbi:DNA repair photolyase [Spirochaeta africana DSM 8902]|uniref:DNA repair photolyase n=1 Tax=Spirochaeta africana (strain ATCC 700263 / DSM 8902 / Z-7692) TaxID=889378 RepID=H9UIG3_SPIAZ|nr:DNA repair photolyase [Spirochaeta africana DSM 8902]